MGTHRPSSLLWWHNHKSETHLLNSRFPGKTIAGLVFPVQKWPTIFNKGFKNKNKLIQQQFWHEETTPHSSWFQRIYQIKIIDSDRRNNPSTPAPGIYMTPNQQIRFQHLRKATPRILFLFYEKPNFNFSRAISNQEIQHKESKLTIMITFIIKFHETPPPPLKQSVKLFTIKTDKTFNNRRSHLP